MYSVGTDYEETETYTLQLSTLAEKEDITISVPKDNVPDNATKSADVALSTVAPLSSPTTL